MEHLGWVGMATTLMTKFMTMEPKVVEVGMEAEVHHTQVLLVVAPAIISKVQ